MQLMAATLLSRASRFLLPALDIVLPPRCLACRSTVDGQGQLCAACWRQLTFLGDPMCAICGFPFAYEQGPDALCGSCVREAPEFAAARAALRYDEASRGLILALKHGDRTDLAPSLGRWLARAGAALLEGADVLVPVPLHRRRLFARRYNQAALVAEALGRASGLELVPDLLRRKRSTPPQGGLSRSARFRNLEGAIVLPAESRPAVQGRTVVLVDDVMTTGATVRTCSQVLLRGGAREVRVLTVARVVRPNSDPI